MDQSDRGCGCPDCSIDLIPSGEIDLFPPFDTADHMPCVQIEEDGVIILQCDLQQVAVASFRCSLVLFLIDTSHHIALVDPFCPAIIEQDPGLESEVVYDIGLDPGAGFGQQGTVGQQVLDGQFERVDDIDLLLLQLFLFQALRPPSLILKE